MDKEGGNIIMYLHCHDVIWNAFSLFVKGFCMFRKKTYIWKTFDMLCREKLW
jgi:hypothetical protein